MRICRSLLLVLGLGLGAVSTRLLAEALPRVYFNHITVFLSPETYAAIVQSPFLRDEFSAFQEKTVQRDGGAWSYTGIFISGQHTYLELFKAGPFPHLGATIPGQVVFNMWIDDRTLLPLFRDRLAAQTGATLHIDTGRNAQNKPMYDMVKSEGGPASDFGPGMRVDTEIKGYYPDGITREKRLEKAYLPARYLHDVTSFTLTTNEAERNRLIQEPLLPLRHRRWRRRKANCLGSGNHVCARLSKTRCSSDACNQFLVEQYENDRTNVQVH
jgi:Family of unknown function (DUF5829)